MDSDVRTGKRDPLFDHLMACLIFSPRYEWKRRERTPWLNLPSEAWLVDHDTKKAWIMGNYAWTLVFDHQVEWFTFDKAEFGEWARKQGLTFMEETVKEVSIRKS